MLSGIVVGSIGGSPAGARAHDSSGKASARHTQRGGRAAAVEQPEPTAVPSSTCSRSRSARCCRGMLAPGAAPAAEGSRASVRAAAERPCCFARPAGRGVHAGSEPDLATAAGGRGGAHCPPDSAHPSGTLRYRPRDLQGLHDGPEGPALRPRSRRPRAERCSSAGERRSRSGLDAPDLERARRAWAGARVQAAAASSAAAAARPGPAP